MKPNQPLTFRLSNELEREGGEKGHSPVRVFCFNPGQNPLTFFFSFFFFIKNFSVLMAVIVEI